MNLFLFIVVTLAIMMRTFPMVNLQTPTLTSKIYNSTILLPRTKLNEMFVCLCASEVQRCGMEYENDILIGVETQETNTTFLNVTSKIFTCDFPSGNVLRFSCSRYTEERPNRPDTFYINVRNSSVCDDQCCLTLQWSTNVTLNNISTANTCGNNTQLSNGASVPSCITSTRTSHTTNSLDGTSLVSVESTTHLYALTSTSNSSITATARSLVASEDHSTLILAASIAGGGLFIVIASLVIVIWLCRIRRRKRPNSVKKRHSFVMNNLANEYSELNDTWSRSKDTWLRASDKYESAGSPTGHEKNASKAKLQSSYSHVHAPDEPDCAKQKINANHQRKESKTLNGGQFNGVVDLNEITKQKSSDKVLYASTYPHTTNEPFYKVEDYLQVFKTQEASNDTPVTPEENHEYMVLDNVKLQVKANSTHEGKKLDGLNDKDSHESSKNDLLAPPNPQTIYETIDKVEDHLQVFKTQERSNDKSVTSGEQHEYVDLDNISLQAKANSTHEDECLMQNVHILDESTEDSKQIEKDCEATVNTFCKISQAVKQYRDELNYENDREDSGENGYSRLTSSKGLRRVNGITDSILATYDCASGTLMQQSGTSHSETEQRDKYLELYTTNRAGEGDAEKMNEYHKLSNSKKIGHCDDSFLDTYDRGSGTPKQQSDSREAYANKTNEYARLSTSKRGGHRAGISTSFLQTYGPTSAKSPYQVDSTDVNSGTPETTNKECQDNTPPIVRPESISVDNLKGDDGIPFSEAVSVENRESLANIILPLDIKRDNRSAKDKLDSNCYHDDQNASVNIIFLTDSKCEELNKSNVYDEVEMS